MWKEVAKDDGKWSGVSRAHDRSIVPSYILSAITTLVVMAGLLLVDGSAGSLTIEARRTTLLAPIAVAFVVLMLVMPVRWRTRVQLMPIGTGAILAIGVASPPLNFVTLVLTLCLVAATACRYGLVSHVRDGIVPACLALISIRFAVDLVPQWGRAGEAVLLAAGSYVQAVTRTHTNVSASALGMSAVTLAAVFLLWRWRFGGGVARVVAAILLPLAWFAVLPWVVPPATAGPMATFYRTALLGLACVAGAVVVDIVVPERARLTSPSLITRSKLIPILAFLAAYFAGMCLVGTSMLGPVAGRTIKVHNRGGMDWDRPVFGKFGAFSGGMFGQLPVYCNANGYDFSVIDKDGIDSKDLRETQVLVLINSPHIWKGIERRTILDFVSRGGSLLVLGDHTDVFGLMNGFNSLLDAFGIQFQFDSAYHARSTWRGCQVAAPDAVSARWDSGNPSVAIGASLALSKSARPLLTGRYAFSDQGVRENVVGSFLGNYHYDAGERLGDVVLVATAVHGHGRVIVWGDTSAYQGGLSYSFPRVVGPLFEYLCRPAAWTEQPIVRATAAVLLLATIAWLWVSRAPAAHVAIVAGGLFTGMSVIWLLSLPNLETPIRIAEDTVLVDKSHLPATGHYEARVNSVGPLYTNLFRSGFRVADMERWDRTAFSRARAMALVAPQKSFSQAEVDDLVRYEESGGIVILAVGQPDSPAVAPFLQRHGLTLAPRPLGTVPQSAASGKRKEQEQPRFLDAWPIVTLDGHDLATDRSIEIIYRVGPDVIALFKRVGRGGLLFFADTRYFSSMNVEDMSGHWIGNLALIHDLFVKYLGAKPDEVLPLFPSPKKPD